MNVIKRLEFELAYFKATIQYFSHYATGISSKLFCKKKYDMKYVLVFNIFVLIKIFPPGSHFIFIYMFTEKHLSF